jgi:hypothetical protein
MNQPVRFSLATLTVSRWRNGGGETRQIISWPLSDPGPVSAGARSTATDDFAWRASIASIDRDGDFSAFPGIDRIITLLEGDGVTLQGPPAINHPLTCPGAPFAFAGEQPITARLAGGVSRDFNIMTRRRDWRATAASQQSEFHLPAGHSGVVYVMAGHWLMNDDNCPLLTECEGVWWHDLSSSRRLAPQGTDCLALWADIVAR